MTVLSSYTIVSVNNIYQCCTGKSPLFSSLFVEDQIFLTTLKFGKFQSGNMFYWNMTPWVYWDTANSTPCVTWLLFVQGPAGRLYSSSWLVPRRKPSRHAVASNKFVVCSAVIRPSTITFTTSGPIRKRRGLSMHGIACMQCGLMFPI